MKTCRYVADERAFTLVEVIVSLILLGILSAIAGTGFVLITQGYVFSKRNAETVQKSQVAMTRIVKELAAICPSPCQGITAAAANSITYTRQPCTDPCPATDTIALSGETIQIDGITLLDNVTAFSLSYFDAAGNATAILAIIRRAEISFTVRGADNQPSTFTDSIEFLESYW